jgi:hypothetical protein
MALKSEANCVQREVVRSLEIDNAILKNNYNTMVDDIKEVKGSIKTLTQKMDDFINSVDDKYVSKTELKDKLLPIYDKIEVNKTSIAKIFDWIAKYGPVVAILAYIILGKIIGV